MTGIIDIFGCARDVTSVKNKKKYSKTTLQQVLMPCNYFKVVSEMH